jgi:hypothetical protein
MSVQPRIRGEHLAKLHREMEAKKHFGSILIQYQDGKVTGVSVKDEFNTRAFVDYCERPEKRVVVKSRPPQEPAHFDKETAQIDEQPDNVEQGNSITSNEEGEMTGAN